MIVCILEGAPESLVVEGSLEGCVVASTVVIDICTAVTYIFAQFEDHSQTAPFFQREEAACQEDCVGGRVRQHLVHRSIDDGAVTVKPHGEPRVRLCLFRFKSAFEWWPPWKFAAYVFHVTIALHFPLRTASWRCPSCTALWFCGRPLQRGGSQHRPVRGARDLPTLLRIHSPSAWRTWGGTYTTTPPAHSVPTAEDSGHNELCNFLEFRTCHNARCWHPVGNQAPLVFDVNILSYAGLRRGEIRVVVRRMRMDVAELAMTLRV